MGVAQALCECRSEGGHWPQLDRCVPVASVGSVRPGGVNRSCRLWPRGAVINSVPELLSDGDSAERRRSGGWSAAVEWKPNCISEHRAVEPNSQKPLAQDYVFNWKVVLQCIL